MTRTDYSQPPVPLPAFRSVKRCPKCNGSSFDREYCNGVRLDCYEDARVDDHHHLRCAGCGYRWAEALYVPPTPLDPDAPMTLTWWERRLLRLFG